MVLHIDSCILGGCRPLPMASFDGGLAMSGENETDQDVGRHSQCSLKGFITQGQHNPWAEPFPTTTSTTSTDADHCLAGLRRDEATSGFGPPVDKVSSSPMAAPVQEMVVVKPHHIPHGNLYKPGYDLLTLMGRGGHPHFWACFCFSFP